MKTTKTQFKRFKTEFLWWVEQFGLKEYEIMFYHADLCSTKKNYADLFVSDEGKLAEVRFSTIVPGSIEPTHAEDCAKHEAIHLLLRKLSWIAACRCLNDGEIQNENEAITRRLEKVL